MPQKILACHAGSLPHSAARLLARVDQIVLARQSVLPIKLALGRGLDQSQVETAVAYDCRSSNLTDDALSPALLEHGVLVGRQGVGFPGTVHLERFASPGRLALTDDSRLAMLGGIGMLTLVASPSQLAQALLQGDTQLRAMRSIQVLFSGKLRPFSCARDVALELARRGLEKRIERLSTPDGSAIIVEFAGPSARLLSVPERALLCGAAAGLGAAGAVFVSDEKTEVYLRDQRRSKAYRALIPDPGAPCDDVLTLDLGAVDPLLEDANGKVHDVRELNGEVVSQVIVGGDSGAPIKDILAVAALLKSKRVPPHLDFLIATPSRQALEILATNGALVDLVATGARFVEPELRLLDGEGYPAPHGGLSLRSFATTRGCSAPERSIVASAETLAFAVSTGCVGDPRGFKRQARVTVPRTLPTDDVLILRKKLGTAVAPLGITRPPSTVSLNDSFTCTIATLADCDTLATNEPSLVLLVAETLPAPHQLTAASQQHNIRAIVCSALDLTLVSLISGMGLVALSCSHSELALLKRARSATVERLLQDDSHVLLTALNQTLKLAWPADSVERRWAIKGHTFD